MSDDYVHVTAALVNKTKAAAYIENETASGWVPRSCMHASDDIALKDMEEGDERTFRIREWKAEEVGFI